MLTSAVSKAFWFIYLYWNAGWIWEPNTKVYDTAYKYASLHRTIASSTAQNW